MFEPYHIHRRPRGSSTYARIADDVVNNLLFKDDNYLVRHEELEELIGSEYGSSRYSSIVQAVIRKMRSLGRTLQSERGEGYRLMPRYMNAVIAQKHMIKADNQVNIARTIVAATDTNGFSSEQQEHHVRTVQEIVGAQQAMGAWVPVWRNNYHRAKAQDRPRGYRPRW